LVTLMGGQINAGNFPADLFGICKLRPTFTFLSAYIVGSQSSV
jgi:uncharacterized membrane protein (GlpM family)